MRKKLLKLIVPVCLLLCLTGCFGPEYAVDYNGKADSFRGARDAYRAGTRVTLYYGEVGTDTDYVFTLEGAELTQDYSPKKGYILRFTMPAHDVKLTVEARDSMFSGQETEDAAVLTFSSFDGGGPSYDVEIADPTVLACASERRYADENHEELDGAAFSYVFTFTGLKPGKTAVTVRYSSPISDASNGAEHYEATVDEALRVKLTPAG